MTEDDLATRISKAAERVTMAMHEALTAEGVPTNAGNIFACTMVFSVTLTAALTSYEDDAKTVRSFKQGLELFRADQMDRGGATLQ